MNPTDKVTVDDIDRAPSNLPVPDGHVSREDYNTFLNRFSDLSEKHIKRLEENAELKKQINTSIILDRLIKPFAVATFMVVCLYCLCVAATLVVHGLDYVRRPLSDTVLQTLVGSTAVTVIGLMGMVLTGIFVGARK